MESEFQAASPFKDAAQFLDKFVLLLILDFLPLAFLISVIFSGSASIALYAIALFFFIVLVLWVHSIYLDSRRKYIITDQEIKLSPEYLFVFPRTKLLISDITRIEYYETESAVLRKIFLGYTVIKTFSTLNPYYVGTKSVLIYSDKPNFPLLRFVYILTPENPREFIASLEKLKRSSTA